MTSILKLLFLTALLLLASCASRQVPDNDTAGTAAVPAVVKASRSVFKHSILPGGVATAGELKERLSSDRVARKHYAGVAVDKLRPVQLERDRSAYVSYRKGSSVYWTRKPVRIPAGELILTSGSDSVRSRCGNRISDTPQLPVAKFEEPPLGELDEVVPPELPGRLTLAGLPTSALPAVSAMAGHPMVTDREGSAAAAAESSPFTPHPGSYGWGPGGFAPIAGGSSSSRTSPQANNPAAPSTPSSPEPAPGSGSSAPQGGSPDPGGPTIVIPILPSPPVVTPPGPTPSNPPSNPGVPQPPTVTPPVTIIPQGIVPPPIDPKTPLGPPIDPDRPIDLQPVPEPATWLLLGAGFVILMASARIKAASKRARSRK